jgi:hypothetical protein
MKNRSPIHHHNCVQALLAFMHLFLQLRSFKSTIHLDHVSVNLQQSKRSAYRLHHDTSNLIWVTVGSWSSILKVTITFMTAFSWDTDRCTTVGNAGSEGINATSLVFTGKTHGVVLSVNSNVLLVATLKLLDGCFDVLHTTLDTHLLGRVVAVKTSSIPVTWDWLRVERDLGTELFSNTVEEETGYPKVVTH